MKGKYLKTFGSVVFAAIMLSGIGFVAADTAEAQRRHGRRRVIIVNPYRYYNRYHAFGYDRWGYNRWGYDRWGNRYGYDPWSSHFRYSRYVFDNRDKATAQAYKDGFKTGKDDGKKAKSYKPERSHYYKEAGFGNFGEVYRSGFATGYKDGYRTGMNERNLREAD
ncbi:MAG TPA: hypothetical protein VIT88_05150 [Pyrinomonadaceae bacterium]